MGRTWSRFDSIFRHQDEALAFACVNLFHTIRFALMCCYFENSLKFEVSAAPYLWAVFTKYDFFFVKLIALENFQFFVCHLSNSQIGHVVVQDNKLAIKWPSTQTSIKLITSILNDIVLNFSSSKLLLYSADMQA